MNTYWKPVRLSDVVEVASGQVDPREKPFCDMPHVGGDNIESNTGRLLELSTAKDLGLISGKYLFDEKHVLYSKIRPALNKVVAPNFKGICSADIYPIRGLDGKLCREYLVYLLRSKSFFDYAAMHSSRTNIPKINRNALLAYETLLPPLAEQRRIAAILDKADAILRKREEGIRLTEELLSSTFLEMFGNPATNPKKWPGRRVGELAEIQGGLQVAPVRETHTIKVPYLRVANVYRDRLRLEEIKQIGCTEGELQRVRLAEGDILLVEGHGNREEIGRAAVWDGSIEHCVHQNHLIRLRVNRGEVLPEYLNAYLNSDGGRRHLVGLGKTTSGLNTISVSNVRQVPVLVPPLDLQQSFSKQILKVKAVLATRKSAFTVSSTLFVGLGQRAFRGQL